MAKIKTKAYTIARLISEVRSLNSRKITDVSTLANALSPRKGFKSAKVVVLNQFLNGGLDYVAADSFYGNSVKARVISALKQRKNLGWF